MAKVLKIGGGKFSALASSGSRNPKRDTSASARMLDASERKSLREFANSRIESGSVLIKRDTSGRFVITAGTPHRAVVSKRSSR